MEKQPHSRAHLIVALVLLLLSALYVGSYLALVLPGSPTGASVAPNGWYVIRSHYRSGGRYAELAFWPLEQIDRKVRPEAWAFETYRHSTGEWPSTYRP